MCQTLYKQISAAKERQNDRWSLESSSIDPLKYKLLIIQSEESIYHGGIFYFNLTFQAGYPFYPPSIKAITKIYHPNISIDPDKYGCMHVEYLLSEWKMNKTVIQY